MIINASWFVFIFAGHMSRWWRNLELDHWTRSGWESHSRPQPFSGQWNMFFFSATNLRMLIWVFHGKPWWMMKNIDKHGWLTGTPFFWKPPDGTSLASLFGDCWAVRLWVCFLQPVNYPRTEHLQLLAIRSALSMVDSWHITHKHPIQDHLQHLWPSENHAISGYFESWLTISPYLLRHFWPFLAISGHFWPFLAISMAPRSPPGQHTRWRRERERRAKDAGTAAETGLGQGS